MSRSVPTVRRSRLDLFYICNTCRNTLSPLPIYNAATQVRWITRNHIQRIKDADEEWGLRAADIRAGKKISVLQLLEQRGYVNQIAGNRDVLNNLMIEQRCGAYVGVDPTAPSLHVGHMVPFMALGWLYIHGYPVNFLLGGGTVRVGDPTDRLAARDTPHSSIRKANMASMHLQLKRLGASMERYAERRGYSREWAWRRNLVNNSVWWDKLPMLDFMKVMGNGMRIGPMLGRDTVKNRMEKGSGMSFAEFCYPLMQAWDWWELFQSGCQIQIGGADQFGNILAGAEAVKYMVKNDPAYLNNQKLSGNIHTSSPRLKGIEKPSTDPMGFTVPLLTTASGEKFGKSAGNAIWLDKDMTSTYDLYQFFLRTADADVERYLNVLTFLPARDVTTVMEEHKMDESKRIAQHLLAREFVELIYGLGEAQEAERQHRLLFNRSLSLDDVRPKEEQIPGSPEDHPAVAAGGLNNTVNKFAPQTNASNMPSTHMKLPRSLVENRPITRVLWSAGLVVSRSEGHRLAEAGGCHVGSKADGKGDMGGTLSFAPIQNWRAEDTAKYIIDENLLILRVGKWKMKIINIVSDEEYEAEGLTCPGWKEPMGENAGRTDYKVAQRKKQAFLDTRNQARGVNRIKRFSFVLGDDGDKP